MTKGLLAKDYHTEGYNCAQSVFLAYAEELGLDKAFAARLVNALGAGISQTGGICGAVSAGCLVLSGFYGRETGSREGEQWERNQRAYRLVQELQRRFEAEFTATGCPALLAKGLADSGEAKNDKINCPRYVERAADIVAELTAAEESAQGHTTN